MNTPSPLIPQGTFPDKGKSHIRIAVFTILAIHVVILGALLIAGCKRTEEPPPLADTTNVFTPAPFEPPPVTPVPPPVTNVPAPAPGIVTPPIDTPPPPPPPAGLGTEHTIIKGESFYTLGKKYGVSFKAIAEANPGVDPTRLKIGQKVNIPPPRAGAPAGAGVNGAAADGTQTYKVRSGDNLGKIAKAHGVTVPALRRANGLRTDQIKVGQTLKIPAKPAPAPPALDAGTLTPPPVGAPGTVPNQ
jgi:LysM repeat protein